MYALNSQTKQGEDDRKSRKYAGYDVEYLSEVETLDCRVSLNDDKDDVRGQDIY